MNNDIKELANNLFFDKALDKENKDYYVPIFDEEIDNLRDEIFNSEFESQCFYVAGQSGTGKTTALNFLPNKEISEKFIPIYINYRDLLAFDDADIIDVLLMFAYRLTQEDKKLKKIFEDELNKIEKKHNKSLEIESQKVINKSAEVGNDSKVSAGFSFFNFFKAQTDFFVSFKMDKQVRKHTREFFTFKKIDLLKTVNIIIEKLYDLKGINKELLVFFDDFDKLRNYEQIHSIFVDNRSFIEQINCRKIISIPINLTTDQDFSNSSTNLKVFAVKLLINPLIKGSTTKQNTIISNNKKLLFEIIKKRDPKKLINDDAIEKAIEYSGGILRQFVQLLKDATVNVRRFGSDKISVNDVNKAIEDKSLQLSLTVIGVDIIKLYKYIMEKNKPDTPKNTEFVTALLNLRVILHANGLYWYDLNPLIKKTVETYSKEKLDLENP